MCKDFGFDPLGLGAVPENLERFKESELIHCRWAMLAVVSCQWDLNAWNMPQYLSGFLRFDVSCSRIDLQVEQLCAQLESVLAMCDWE